MSRTTWTLPLALSAVAAIVAAAEPASNMLTAEEEAAGWKLLFDGKSTDGWRNYKKTDVGPGWKIEDGALVRAAGGAGDIVTKDQFAAFELSLEYIISKGGNSGIMFHVTEEEGAPWHTGPEIQVQDNKDGHDPQLSGWLYQLYKPEIDATRPAGEWNQVRVLITPEKCSVWMNGKHYYDFVKGSQDWDERVAKSKFAKMSGFGKPQNGHICLQDHGNPVSYRNIKIRPIP